MADYDHKKLETKWRKRWEEAGIYEPLIESSENKLSNKNKKEGRGLKQPFYNLMMFPYPSAEGLHVGNVSTFTGVDAYGRFKRMQGYDVFEPIGLDGFGIHSENYALKIGKHPTEQAKVSEKRFYEQLKLIGNGFSWNQSLETYDPDYYRWTQWMFVQMFKQGLAYRGRSMVNWCPSCKTVLADEQVEGGICERCKTEAEKREMEQWFFKITEYADRLLNNIYGSGKLRGPTSKSRRSDLFGPVPTGYDPKKNGLRWPEKIKTAQRQWIGKKAGINIAYKIKETDETVDCFTTRPDTNFGATFVVLGPEHPHLEKREVLGLSEKVWKRVDAYRKNASKKSEIERLAEGRKKTGVFLERYCVNDLNGEKMPLYVSDFVLGDVGTGVVVGVPGHDRRDFEFAKEFSLSVKRVVVGLDGDTSAIKRIEQVNEGEGRMVNSEFLDGLEIHKAIEKIMDYLEKGKMGKRTNSYHLRDWLISRQRYWGPPIPMIFCPDCAKRRKSWVNSKLQIPNDKQSLKSKIQIQDFAKQMYGWFPVSEKDLPVELPFVKDWEPTGDGKSPLEKAPDKWLFTKCPGCGGKAKRETDVSDTFLDSSWYFLAYPNIETKEWKGKKIPFNKENLKKWLPVDAYIGGAEHAVLHLLYSRFVAMALHDWGYLDFEEPFPFLYGHGLIIKDGAKMSKSRGNVVVPDEYIEKFGADTLRMYLRFVGPFDQGGDFRDTGIVGMRRFLDRVWRLFRGKLSNSKLQITNKTKISNSKNKTDQKLEGYLHRTIKNVTEDMEKLKFNTCVAKLMTFVNVWSSFAEASEDDKIGGKSAPVLSEHDLSKFLRLLAPLAPFISEELWQGMVKGHTCSDKNCLMKRISGKELKKSSIHVAQWPNFDESLTFSDEVELVVQVNGKLRARMTVDSAKAKNKEAIVALAKKDKAVLKYLEGKKIRKTIWVPGKLVNFVV